MSRYKRRDGGQWFRPMPKPIPANAEKFFNARGEEVYRCKLCGNSPFSRAGIKAHLTPTGQGNKNCQNRRNATGRAELPLCPNTAAQQRRPTES